MAVREILTAHQDDLYVDVLSRAVEALADCAVHCNACADACLEEDTDMARCIRACVDCADICQATGAVVARAGASGAPWLELVRVCATASANCAQECDKHDTDHCRACAEACRSCERICRELLEVAG